MAAKLGTGERFAALVSKLRKRKPKTTRGRKAAASRPGGGKVKNPRALAAWIGRRKYGKGRFQKLAAAGRKAAY